MDKGLVWEERNGFYVNLPESDCLVEFNRFSGKFRYQVNFKEIVFTGDVPTLDMAKTFCEMIKDHKEGDWNE